jgi:ubiquinone/menaquinone biosynthesis C-methylase UbiE
MTEPGGHRLGESRLRVLLRNGIERLYSRFAGPYDWLSETLWAGQWRTWQRAVLPFVQGPRVLEVGMGTGNLLLDLLDLGFDAYGIDRAPDMLRVASRKITRIGRPILASRADITALPFVSASFDSVVATNASGYILMPQTYSEIERVLRSGGRFIIMTGGILLRGSRLQAIRGLLFPGAGRSKQANSHASTPSLVIYPYESGDDDLGYWTATIKHHMEAVHLKVTMYVAPTGVGSAFLVVGEKEA